MSQNVLALIVQKFPTFSKGQRRIANYILEEYDKAAFMTASKLGKTVNVSESTVVRFASELGYDGYPSMRKAIQDTIKNRLTSMQRIEVARNLIDENDVLTSVLTSDIEKIQMTINEVDRKAFDEAVEAILSGNTIYIMGMRSSAGVATFLSFYLNMLLPNVRLISANSTGEVFEQILRIGEKDVFIAISFPRYSKRTIKAMQFAKDRGAHVIGITDSEASPISNYSDIKLFAKSDMVYFIDSLVAPLSLINALLAAVADRCCVDLSEDFAKLERIWSDYEVYEQDS